ncbi:TauD/TfdA family dioxygenase [Streptomyces sp. NPDC048018]|uniref:TauD/TfdA family dioxygenase n=1 Tax=Streptomyces sp. NPDC048018 TaxID=3365499 RepID=UPI0037231A3E
MTELRMPEAPLSWVPATLKKGEWLLPPPDGQPDEAWVGAVHGRLWQGTGFVLVPGLQLGGLTERQCVERCARIVGQVCAPVGLRLQRSAGELLTAATAPAVPRTPDTDAPATPDGDDRLLLPHTDRGERPRPPRLLALLCIRPASEGGESLLASGPALRDHLATERPEALRELSGDFRFGRGPDFDRVRPVFRLDGGTPRVHYNRYWIRRGQDETGTPFSPARADALDAMDALLHDPAVVLSLPLRRGDLLLVNNSAVLHGRNPFHDAGAPGGGRCYARIWAD